MEGPSSFPPKPVPPPAALAPKQVKKLVQFWHNFFSLYGDEQACRIFFVFRLPLTQTLGKLNVSLLT